MLWVAASKHIEMCKMWCSVLHLEWIWNKLRAPVLDSGKVLGRNVNIWVQNKACCWSQYMHTNTFLDYFQDFLYPPTHPSFQLFSHCAISNYEPISHLVFFSTTFFIILQDIVSYIIFRVNEQLFGLTFLITTFHPNNKQQNQNYRRWRRAKADDISSFSDYYCFKNTWGPCGPSQLHSSLITGHEADGSWSTVTSGEPKVLNLF